MIVFLKSSKNIDLERSGYEWEKMRGAQGVGRCNIIWKRKETVAFLLIIFKFLVIYTKNNSSESKR